MGPLFSLFAILLAVMVGKILVGGSANIFLLVFFAIVFAIVVFRVKDSTLTFILLLTLALGSCYRWDIVLRSFYLRFFLLFLIALRAGLLFFQSKKSPKANVEAGSTIFHILFLVVGITGILSSFYSVDSFLSFKRASSFLLLYFVVFVYYWIRCSDIPKCEIQLIMMWRGIAFILGLGFLFLLIGQPGMFSGGRLRLVVGNPNQLGHYCALMAPIVVWFMFDKAVGKTRILAWSLFIALLVAVVGSGSRGALVTLILVLSIQFALCYREKAVMMGGIAILGIALHFLIGSQSVKPGADPTFFEETVIRKKTLETGSGRLDVWESALQLSSRKPWFGYGFAIVDRLFQRGYFPNIPITFQGGHIHNGYIEELVNLGWIGASPLFLMILYVLVFGGVQLLPAKVRTSNFRLAIAMFCTIIAGSLSLVFESWMTSVGSVFCFPFWFSVMLFMRIVKNNNDWLEPKVTT